MNVILWIVQVLLALPALAGGAYKIFQYEELAKVPAAAALPRVGWSIAGGFELVCGVLLIAPAAIGWMPTLTPLAGAALAVESFALAVLYARYSMAMSPENPLVFAAVMTVLAAFVFIGRTYLSPFG